MKNLVLKISNKIDNLLDLIPLKTREKIDKSKNKVISVICIGIGFLYASTNSNKGFIINDK